MTPDKDRFPYPWQSRPTWLGEDPADILWLESVFGAPAGLSCAILYGNEDSPSLITGWMGYNPPRDTPPDWVWNPPLDVAGDSG